MKIPPFRLERYFAQYEFSASYLLGSSDCESLAVGDLLDMQPGARAEFDRLWCGYTESLGHPVLREEISRLYPGLDPGQILVHSGAEEAIFLFFNAALQPGDHVIIHWPCYQSLYEVARSIGCDITLWPGDPADGWRLDLGELRARLRADTRAVVVNCPHNPTGYLMDASSWLDLNELSARSGFLLFSDEVYRYLEYDPSVRLSPACEINERAVTLNVLSKSFGLAGLRIGWIATRDQDVYRRMAGFKDYTTICNSAPSEFLGILALRSRERIIERNRRLILQNLSLLDEFFAAHADRVAWVRPKAGPIAFPRLAGGANAEEFCRALVESAGVMLTPGGLYAPEYDGHFRIGYGRANFPEALARLSDFLSSR